MRIKKLSGNEPYHMEIGDGLKLSFGFGPNFSHDICIILSCEASDSFPKTYSGKCLYIGNNANTNKQYQYLQYSYCVGLQKHGKITFDNFIITYYKQLGQQVKLIFATDTIFQFSNEEIEIFKNTLKDKFGN